MRKRGIWSSALILTQSHAWETAIFQHFGSNSQTLTSEKRLFFSISAQSHTISHLRNQVFFVFQLILAQSHAWETTFFQRLASISYNLTREKVPFFKRLRSFSHCLTIQKLLVIAHFHTFSPLRNDHISAFGLNRTQNHTWKSDPFKRFGPFSHYLILVNNFFLISIKNMKALFVHGFATTDKVRSILGMIFWCIWSIIWRCYRYLQSWCWIPCQRRS